MVVSGGRCQSVGGSARVASAKVCRSFGSTATAGVVGVVWAGTGAVGLGAASALGSGWAGVSPQPSRQAPINSPAAPVRAPPQAHRLPYLAIALSPPGPR